MKHHPEYIAELIFKYRTGTLDQKEKGILEEWLTIEENRNYFNEINRNEKVWDWEHQPVIDSGRIWERINTGIQEEEAIVIRQGFNWKRTLAAASVVAVVLAAGAWLLWRKPVVSPKDQPIIAAHQQELLPGTDKAILTLADGKIIDLNEAQKGQIARESGVSIEKSAEGQLEYTLKDHSPYPHQLSGSQAVSMNTVSTPRGGQYKVILPDQTTVWLNAASSIRFPPVFTGRTRTVEITGEAYFEVKKNTTVPFVVKIKDMEVTVLGTHFNVMGYNDEAVIRTTLIEGSVKVTDHGSLDREDAVVLKPGQQSDLDRNGRLTVARDVNTDQAIAWVKGYFQFKNEDVATIMRQVARWYNVDVTYRSGIPSGRYTGTISRNTHASEVLKMLQVGGIQYKIEDNHLIIQ